MKNKLLKMGILGAKIAIIQLPIRSSAAEIHFVLLQQLLEVLTTGVAQKQTSNLIYVVSLNLVCRSALWFTSFVRKSNVVEDKLYVILFFLIHTNKETPVLDQRSSCNKLREINVRL